MNITQFAIKNDRLTFFLVVVFTLFGIKAYFDMPKAQDPGFTIRTAVINTSLPGASPARVEQLVTDKIEQAIQQMPELDFVRSDSQTGKSVIYANFKESYTDMRPIFDDLRRKVEATQSDLPSNAIGPFVNDEFGDVFGVIYTLTGEGFSYAELKTTADQIRNRLLMLSEVAKVEIHGAQDEVVYVEYNNARLRELGLSPGQLRVALQDLNILSSGGDITIGRERITLEPSGNFESLEDIKLAVISVPDSQVVVQLGDIAEVSRGYEQPLDVVVHANGQPALAIAVSMKAGGNVLELGTELERVMSEIKAGYPYGLEVDTVVFQPTQVSQSIAGFMVNLVQAVVIVLLVMLVFLGLRTGLVVAALIPTAMLLSFMVMQWFGIGINKMSLAALIIALGLLVDNAIVMAEGIMIRLEQGEERFQAAVATGREMLVPLLISSLTTASAFLPIVLAESAIGEFTADIAKVVTIALVVSWLLAMTFIPLLAMTFIRVKQRASSSDTERDSATLDPAYQGWLYRYYHRLLTFALHNRLIFLGLILGMFVLGVKGFSLVKTVFIPPRPIRC